MHSETTIRFNYIYIYKWKHNFSKMEKGIFQTRNTRIFVQARVTVLLDYNACFVNNLRMIIEQKESIYGYRALCKSSE